LVAGFDFGCLWMHVNRRVRVLADHATVTEVVEGNVHCRFQVLPLQWPTCGN
jgi:hypothetical protein